MRPEKQLLVDEVVRHLKKSDYCFLVTYTKMTMPDLNDLRATLRKFGAEFHVVKNTILGVAAQQLGLPKLDPFLGGQVGLISGGNQSVEIYQFLTKYAKDKDKLPVKGALLSRDVLTNEQFGEVTKLPPIAVLRAQLLGLLNTPATSLVSVLNATPTGLVTVLNAVPQGLANVLKAAQEKAEAAEKAA